MAEEKTTIAIKVSTRDRIKDNGVMGDDYDIVIIRALDALDHTNGKLPRGRLRLPNPRGRPKLPKKQEW